MYVITRSSIATKAKYQNIEIKEGISLSVAHVDRHPQHFINMGASLIDVVVSSIHDVINTSLFTVKTVQDLSRKIRLYC